MQVWQRIIAPKVALFYCCLMLDRQNAPSVRVNRNLRLTQSILLPDFNSSCHLTGVCVEMISPSCCCVFTLLCSRWRRRRNLIPTDHEPTPMMQSCGMTESIICDMRLKMFVFLSYSTYTFILATRSVRRWWINTTCIRKRVFAVWC